MDSKIVNLSSKRIFGLDLLRAFAVIFVFIDHWRYLLPTPYSSYLKLFVLDGVTIFFVLSGFLVGRILIIDFYKGSHMKSVFHFWVRRWFRTLPVYYVVLTIVVLLNFISKSYFDLTGVNVLMYYVFAQNIFYNHPDFFPELWSLSVEEWFYFLIPLVIMLFYKALNIPIKASLLLAIVIFTFYSIGLRLLKYFWIINDFDLEIRKQVFTRFDSLMIGILGAFIFFYFEDIWKKFKLVGLLVGIFLILNFNFGLVSIDSFIFNSGLSLTIFSMSILFLLPYLSNLNFSKDRFFIKPVVYVSKISYSLYLVHLTLVQGWVIRPLIDSDIVSPKSYFFLSIIYLFFSFSFASIFYFYVERPFLRIRDSFAS